jgi:UDP-N-acetyl-D-glucosamine dehydrogenase
VAESTRKIAIIGQGYVGLPAAIYAADAGNQVVGVDVDEQKVTLLNEGRSYVEDVSSLRLRDALSTGRYLATTDYSRIAGFDVALITVPTPLTDGTPDLSYVEAAARAMGSYLRAGSLVVLESTTYPGTTQELVGPVLEAVSGLRAGSDFLLGYSPERIDPGNDRWNFATTPKIVSGIDAASCSAVREFYDGLVETTVPVSSPRVAELAKIIENTFRHVNIALINEFAMLAHQLDLDIWESIDAASTKPFGFMKFVPGPGVGGHCLPIDPRYLSWQAKQRLGQNFRFVELANDINDHMPNHVVTRIVAILNRMEKSVRGSQILVLGLAYKRNSADTRESPAIRIVNLLCELGGDVRLVDPYVAEEQQYARAPHVKLVEQEVVAADLVVLLTDHDTFDLDMVQRTGVPTLDCRGRMSGRAVERL